VFAALIITSSEGHEVFGFAAFAFWVFTVIDAYRSAEEIVRRGVVNREPLFSSDSDQIKLPIWGGVLMLLGLLFFMSNLGAFSLRSVVWFAWPLLFVGAGLYLILTYWFKDEDRSNRAAAVVTHRQPDPPPAPVVAPDGMDENPENSG
jgi:4-hydroxybenzoate polyprenyltransferase